MQVGESNQPSMVIQFYGILNGGGFDVIIGNPPYVAAAKVRKSYAVRIWRLTTARTSTGGLGAQSESPSHQRQNGNDVFELGFSGDLIHAADYCSGLQPNGFLRSVRIPAALFNFDVRVRNTVHLRLNPSCQLRFTHTAHAGSSRASHAFPTLNTHYSNLLCGVSHPEAEHAALALAFEHALRASNRTLDIATSTRATKHVLHFKDGLQTG